MVTGDDQTLGCTLSHTYPLHLINYTSAFSLRFPPLILLSHPQAFLSHIQTISVPNTSPIHLLHSPLPLLLHLSQTSVHLCFPHPILTLIYLLSSLYPFRYISACCVTDILYPYL